MGLSIPKRRFPSSVLDISSVKIIKIGERHRDDTVPKTVDTSRHFKIELRACNILSQPHP